MRRFDEVARLVLGAARSRPLLVVLDDVDGADEASQLLVQYLARTARDDRLLVVVCCRDTAGPLAALAQEPNTTQVELRGLERAAVGEQVSDMVGRAASDAELAAVYDATAGNPFFVGELARQLAAGSTLPGAVPRSVLDAIGQRLGQLSADCAASLRAASLLGTRFAVPLVAAMTGRNVADCLTSLDEAARAALVLEDGAPGERRFAHDLVRDAIVAGLGSAQRVTLHRRAAEAIEAQVAHTEGMVFDLAHHWAETAIDGDRAVAVTWTERAGREAMRLHAYEDGRRWYGRALELGEGVLDEVARCRLMTRVRRRPVPVLGLQRRAPDLRPRGRPGRAYRPSRPGGRGCAGARADLRRGDRPRDPGAVRTRPCRPRRRAGCAPGAGAGPVRLGLRPPLRPRCGPSRC